ncbi:MAG: hypothetical protein ACYTF9_00760 [Planctomycetota bacterium]|jgi:hypothetical protein
MDDAPRGEPDPIDVERLPCPACGYMSPPTGRCAECGAQLPPPAERALIGYAGHAWRRGVASGVRLVFIGLLAIGVSLPLIAVHDVLGPTLAITLGVLVATLIAGSMGAGAFLLTQAPAASPALARSGRNTRAVAVVAILLATGAGIALTPNAALIPVIAALAAVLTSLMYHLGNVCRYIPDARLTRRFRRVGKQVFIAAVVVLGADLVERAVSPGRRSLAIGLSGLPSGAGCILLGGAVLLALCLVESFAALVLLGIRLRRLRQT